MKQVRNTTASSIYIKDVGIIIPASGTYDIVPQDYGLWAASTEVDAYIDSGILIVSDGYDDLKPVNAKRHIHEESLARPSAFLATGGVHIVTSSTMSLEAGSRLLYIFVGITDGQIIKLGNSTTYNVPHTYKIYNKSSVPISIQYHDGTAFYQLQALEYSDIVLQDNTTENGTWIVASSPLTDIDLSDPSFAGSKTGFEDFLFDAYAGNGGNDNQYSFTATANNGSSDIDGAVAVVGNDYEGIHVLNSLTSAAARPMVEAFNLVNRIKLRAQVETYEIRTRVETLADISQKFTTRYGLMDVNTTGMPANGIIFSYDPIYPVTPVAQVVTATPIVTSKDPTQHFIQTVNGIDYDHVYTTNQIITVTPNSFPNATYQQISITWSRANNFTYSIIINGTTVTYTSDSTATDTEIALGLGNAINNNSTINPYVIATTSGKPITVTSKILGTAFTYSVGTNLTPTLVTANVPIAVYTQTIAGVDYIFTSDGTPTATEVVTGLKNLINADGTCPASATGTTTLILTDKNPPGDTWAYSGSANLTQANTTPSTTATDVVTGLKLLMSSDPAVNVSGTTTLIITAKIPGTAFTYSGTANLNEVLTTANVPEVLYSGNWIASLINNSTVTSYNTGIPVVAGQWYRLKAIVKADGSGVYFYVDTKFITLMMTQVPSAAMRYIFKLEKTLGTSPRTTSIDYIAWKRIRS